MTLASADPFDKPIINANYLAHREDMATFLEGIKMALKVVQTPAMQVTISSLCVYVCVQSELM